jgi:formylglycine-generating enzyme required for sulfatase activity
VKDPALLIPWLTTARNLLAVEMESGGVYRAARERCPMLAIRGISDIVGLQRADAWTKFACSSAAAFTRAFLRTRPVPVGSWHDPGAVNRDGIMDGAHDREARTPGPGKKHAPWGWIFAIAGVCGLSLLAWRWWPDGEDRGPDAQPFAVTLDAPAPVPVPAGMVRFTGARIRSGIFDMSQRPAACAVLKPTEDCARSQDPREVPEIALDDFYLDKHEVTNQELASWLEGKPEMWRLNARDSAVIQTRTEPSVFLVRTGEECSLTLVDGRVRPGPGKAKQPATCMTWMAARDYCRANDKQLPLELEWEFAAKGSEGRAFPWGAPMPRLDGVSFDRGDSTEKHPVDVGTSNQDISPQGVHDLGGNVAEWVADEDGSGETATIRGGSWNSRDPCRLLGSSCKRVQTEEFSRDVGFRCAKRVAKDKGRE